MSLPALRRAAKAAHRVFRPPPKWSLSQWADARRYLSAEASSEPGRWKTIRTPYLREVMDTISDPAYQDVVCKFSAQVGKTEVELNACGYFIDQDPCPILWVMPTLELAEALSKERLAPMFRDSPCFRDKIKEARSRDSGNTLLSKTFPGGHLALAGANSPASLSSRPRRVVIGDEYKSWPKSAGAEGDPKTLAFRRTNNFWNKKRLLVSTPLFKGEDIDKAYDDSDQRHYYVACPHCGEMQELVWKDDTGQIRVIWDKDPDTGRHLPETARYLCGARGCGVLIDLDAHKEAMLAGGQWRKHNPLSRVAGFYLNELYSPWRKLRETVEEYLLAKSDGIESFKSWWNTALGLAWDPQAQGDITAEGFLALREPYPEVVPWGVGCLTASIDVQRDRLEFKVKGWGRQGESWLIHREKIMGSPAFNDVWAKADALLLSGWRHASGRVLFIEACAVDTGDGNVKEAYEWAKARIPRRVYPIKGQGAQGHPLIKKSGNKRLKLWHIGTEAAKDTISARLRLTQPGPGFMHFPDTSIKERYTEDWCNLEMFQELATSEHIVRDRKGRMRRWQKVKPDVRNEDLDLEVYAWAIYTLLNIKPEDMETRLARLEEPLKPEEKPMPSPAVPQVRKPRRKVLNKGYFRDE